MCGKTTRIFVSLFFFSFLFRVRVSWYEVFGICAHNEINAQELEMNKAPQKRNIVYTFLMGSSGRNTRKVTLFIVIIDTEHETKSSDASWHDIIFEIKKTHNTFPSHWFA